MKDWQYTIDGFGSIVTVKQNIDNSVSTVYVDLDSYATRDWTEEEVDQGLPEKNTEWMQEEEPQFTEYGQGAAGKLKFDVEDGVASFAGVKDGMWSEDQYNWPAWLRLLTPAQQLVENVPGVEYVEDPQEAIRNEMGIGETTTIRGRD